MTIETPTLEERVAALEEALAKVMHHRHTVKAFNQAMQIRTTSEPVVDEDAD
jgi:hypothetical protein